MPSLETGRFGGATNWRCGSACGLSQSSGADFSVAAHAHVPNSSLRSVLGPGVSARSLRSVEMTRGWSVDVNEFLTYINAITRRWRPTHVPCFEKLFFRSL